MSPVKARLKVDLYFFLFIRMFLTRWSKYFICERLMCKSRIVLHTLHECSTDLWGLLQVLSSSRGSAGQLDVARQRNERLGLVHLRLQPGSGDGGECLVAVVRSVRCRPERESHPWPANQQMQRLRIRDHDKLRRSCCRHSVPQRLHSRQQSSSGFV